MIIKHITDPDDSSLRVFSRLTEAQLRHAAADGLFIAESPKVIRIALAEGWQPEALLCEERHIYGDAKEIIEMIDSRWGRDIPLFTGSREVLARLTGYELTRGVLCAMRRRKLPTVKDLCENARRVAVLDHVCDTTNIGAIFRSAAALGVDAVLLTKGTCDPLNRRAVRVSMGTVFLVPWTWLDEPIESLHDFGFKTVALALTDRSVSIDDPQLCSEPKLAMLLGTEGDGLPHSTIAGCDYTARIPMAHTVDSLNVAAASAVAFWQLR